MRTWESVVRRRRLARAAIAVATLLAPGAVATAASAATLGVNKACYVISGKTAPSMAVLGSGFTPGDTISITSNAAFNGTNVTANANGFIGLVTGAPLPFFTRPGEKTATLTAQDFSNGTTATTTVTVAPLAVATQPSRAAFTKLVTFYFSGFKPGRFIYAHYLRKHQVARARFGRAKGACGLLKARARLYPGGHPHYKTYKVQIDDSKRYSTHASPRIVTRLNSFLL